MIRTDVVKLLESGSSLVVGTVDGDGLPDANRGWGAWVLHDPERVRFLVSEGSVRTVENLRGGGLVALTASDVVTLRSVQLKGKALRVEEATRDDVELSNEYRREFFNAVNETDAIEQELLDRMVPSGYVAVEFSVTAVYDQTPGPTAGKCIS